MAGPILHPFPCSQDPRLHSPAAELVLSPPSRPSLASTLPLSSPGKPILENPVSSRKTKHSQAPTTDPHQQDPLRGPQTRTNITDTWPAWNTHTTIPKDSFLMSTQNHFQEPLGQARQNAAYSCDWCPVLEGLIQVSCPLYQ